jgi:hypothetical protein
MMMLLLNSVNLLFDDDWPFAFFFTLKNLLGYMNGLQTRGSWSSQKMKWAQWSLFMVYMLLLNSVNLLFDDDNWPLIFFFSHFRIF